MKTIKTKDFTLYQRVQALDITASLRIRRERPYDDEPQSDHFDYELNLVDGSVTRQGRNGNGGVDLELLGRYNVSGKEATRIASDIAAYLRSEYRSGTIMQKTYE